MFIMISFPAFVGYDLHNSETNTNVLMQHSFSKIKITDALFCGKHYYEVICMLFFKCISHEKRIQPGNLYIEQCKKLNWHFTTKYFNPINVAFEVKLL